MIDLAVSEIRRFRLAALIAGFIHLLLLMFMNRISDLLQMSFLEALPLLLGYMAAGLALALVQVGSYRKPSQWAWLMHRPLAPSRIFGALALSALILLGGAILLPMLLVLVGTDVLSTRVVDLRHYLALVHLLAFASIAWLAGAHACVSRSLVAIAVFFGPLLLALHLVSTIVLLLPVTLALGWLGWVTLRSFRADRLAPIRGNLTLILTALPLQIGLFLLCVVLWRFLFVSGGILLGVDPLNTDFPPPAGLVATERAEPAAEIALGLELSEDPRAASWQVQLPLLEPARIGPHLARFPLRHQFSNLPLPTGWYDRQRNTSWTFSHDAMLFIGRNPESGTEQGVFGLGGAGDTTPFTEVPVPTEHGDLLTPHGLYGRDDDAQTLELRHTLRNGAIAGGAGAGSGNERFVSGPQREFGRLILLTNQRLIVLREDHQAAANLKPLLPDWEVPLPRGPQHLAFVSLAQLMDGWLVSFVYGNGTRQIGFNQFNVAVQPWQQVLFVDADGAVEVVGERQIDADFSALQRSDWWLSPPLNVLVALPEVALDKGLTWPLMLTPLPRSPALQVAALLMLLFCLGFAWWWLRPAQLSGTRRAVWLASCAVLGLPALLSLFLLEPRELRR